MFDINIQSEMVTTTILINISYGEEQIFDL